MKFDVLYLKAFGPFTEQTLDFSTTDAGFHLIFGLNEAGKSSALRAITGMLYGIDSQGDDFLHMYKKFRVGARVCLGDKKLEFLRRKGNKNTLLDWSEKLIAEQSLEEMLIGVDRQSFLMQFGLDHVRLREGGRMILADKGEVGETLFAAGSGLSNLREILNDFHKQANELFSERGKNPKINQLLSQVKKQRKEINDIALSGADWLRMNEELSDLKRKSEGMQQVLQKLNKELTHHKRIQGALSFLGPRKDTLGLLAGLGEVPSLDSEFGTIRSDAQKEHRRCSALLEKLRVECERLEKQRASISIPEGLMEQASEVDALMRESGLIERALEDLPKREQQRNHFELQAVSALKDWRPDITLTQADTLRVSRAMKTRLRSLGERRATLQESLRQSQRKLAEAQVKHTRLQQQKETLPERLDVGNLPELLETIRSKGDLLEALKTTRSHVDAMVEQAHIDLKKLGLFSGALEDLETLSVPELESLQRFGNQFEKLDNNDLQITNAISERKSELAGIARELEAIKLDGRLPTLQELQDTRTNRDRNWEQIKACWLGEDVESEKLDPPQMASSYEVQVLQADRVADDLRLSSDRIAQQEQRLLRKAELEQALNDLEARQQQIAHEREEQMLHWQQLWENVKLDRLLPPNEMIPWKHAQSKLAADVKAIREARQNLTQQEELIDGYCKSLLEQFGKIGSPLESKSVMLTDLLSTTRKRIELAQQREAQHVALAEELATQNREFLQAEQHVALAKDELSDWQQQWEKALQEVAMTSELTPAEVQDVLDVQDRVCEDIDKIRELDNRILGMQKQVETFIHRVEQLAKKLAREIGNMSPLQFLLILNDELKNARRDVVHTKELESRLAEKRQEAEEAEVGMRAAQQTLSDLCKRADCKSEEDLPEVEKRVEQSLNLRRKLESIDEKLQLLSGGTGLDEFLAELEQVDVDEITAAISELHERLEETSKERDELNQAIGQAQSRLDSMDGESKAAELHAEVQASIAQIETLSGRYKQLRLAELLLQSEIERYREENQNPILNTASDLFNRLTQNSFQSLRTDFDAKDKQVLVGVRRDEQQVLVDDISDGTRDQLYLALRLATLLRLLEQGVIMPLILDDLLIHFDDERAKAALSVLADLSLKTQVLFFTHNAHMQYLAMEAIPPERIQTHSLTNSYLAELQQIQE